MNNKILIVGVLCLVILSAVLVLNFNEVEDETIKIVGGDNMEEKIFQGPVQEGYDEEHFRLTGESKLLEVKE